MTNVNYAMLYFKYPVPTPIIGEPTQNTLKQLKHKIRANSRSVDTDLGGSDHGYLDLYLSDVEYARYVQCTLHLLQRHGQTHYKSMQQLQMSRLYMPRRDIMKRYDSIESVRK